SSAAIEQGRAPQSRIVSRRAECVVEDRNRCGVIAGFRNAFGLALKESRCRGIDLEATPQRCCGFIAVTLLVQDERACQPGAGVFTGSQCERMPALEIEQASLASARLCDL